MGLPPPIQLGEISSKFIQIFSCNCCFEKHGQEWCKFDLEWALFKERLEVADKNMADSKLDSQVIFDGLVAFFLGQIKGWFETGQDHSGR